MYCDLSTFPDRILFPDRPDRFQFPDSPIGSAMICQNPDRLEFPDRPPMHPDRVSFPDSLCNAQILIDCVFPIGPIGTLFLIGSEFPIGS